MGKLVDDRCDGIQAVGRNEAVVAVAVSDERGFEGTSARTDEAVAGFREACLASGDLGQFLAEIGRDIRVSLDIEVYEGPGFLCLHVDELEESVVEALVMAEGDEFLVGEDGVVYALALREELSGIDLTPGVLLEDFIVDEAHGGFDVLKHEAVEIPGTFCHCGVLGIRRGEVGDFLECGSVKEYYQAVRCAFLDGLVAERGSFGADMSQKASDVEFIGFFRELGSVELDV